MGVYPYLCCHCWHEVGYDFDALADRMVAVSAVTDPFGNYDAAVLARSFGVVRPYKPHYVIDTSVKPAQHVKRSHRETARRAMRNVSVSVADNPEVYADDWVRLYDMLCRRHGISRPTFFRWKQK